MCAELVDTLAPVWPLPGPHRARNGWSEVGAHPLKRQVSSPTGPRPAVRAGLGAGHSVAGLTAYSAARVAIARSTDLCCELFIREGLVQGEIAAGLPPGAWPSWPTTGAWLPRSNAWSTFRRARRARPEELIYAFYDAKLPLTCSTWPASRPGGVRRPSARRPLLQLTRDLS